MADIVFYEKPGCLGNARQKALLKHAGHQLDVRDIISTHWTETELMRFLSALPVSEWFNRNAPAIKEGLIQPGLLDRQEAMTLLLAEPLLIRRPLLEVAGKTWVGFDDKQLSELLPEIEQDDYEKCQANGDGCAR